ncbi:hypothetical protein CHS0354_000972 [Potamilus streckersoni]|uniref:SH3 domain-containing protein n=1 Tax=Potamilus streckersoni TaxID=2493646 RepID=A0AAE0WDT4_9BIVA|nr:hypothetical protein CHS0354_000972 [Potamilus streckersoni]
MAEIDKLLEHEIPEGRQSLQESYINLEKVAQYCKDNYIQAADKKKALEETKNFTTHSLASVAYQINNLATNFLKLLDLQQGQLAEMESSVNHLAETVSIHKEKVARREIGILTTNRSTTRPLGVKNGIIFPEQGEKPTKYQRKPIDYTLLDDIGHGVKLTENQGLIRSASAVSQKSRSSSISSTGAPNLTPAPNTRPPTPPQARQGTISKAQAGHYAARTQAPVVPPPSVPNNYASREQINMQRSAYQPSTPIMMGTIHTPVGMARPMSKSMGPLSPAPGSMAARISHMMQQNSMGQRMTRSQILTPNLYNSSPYLPPPPSGETDINHPPPPPEFTDDLPQEEEMSRMDEDPYAATGPELMNIDWVPKEYIEKVVAIYDYGADKEDELSFSENSVIYVLKKNDDGWWEGMLNGVTGLFPGNYVEPCI